jgi:cytochrome oxidase Cu insertion factor (SCO1/SenC/PrrC family)
MRKSAFVFWLFTMLFLFAGHSALGEEPLDWRDITLKDVNTGEIFKISDFAEKPVLLETFAVWCPVCTQQQKQIRSLHASVGDDVVSISLNVDPFEDESLVASHAGSNGFGWIYAVAPPEMTQLLIKEFGTVVVAAPSAPVFLVCDDHQARYLGRGVKSSSRLLSEVAAGCQAR